MHTLKFNALWSSIFKSFLNDVLLKGVPPSLHLYPANQVISCDVAALMQHCLTAAPDTTARQQSSSGAPAAAAGTQFFVSNDSEKEISVLCEKKEFIEEVVESPCFLEFISRHGRALHYFSP
jgi:hypothetical protein